jgi:WD40 repeat protein
VLLVAAGLIAACARESVTPPAPAAVREPIASSRTVTLPVEITAIENGGSARSVVIGLSDGRVGVWNGRDAAPALHKAHGDRVIAVGLAAGGLDVLSLSSKGRMSRTAVVDGVTKELARVDLGTAPTSASVFSFDGSLLLTGNRPGEIRIFDVSSGTRRQLLAGHRAGMYALALQPGTQVLASAAADADLRIWDLSTGLQLHLADNDLSMLTATFNPRDGSLAAGGTDRRITLRSAGEWKAQTLFSVPAPEIVNALAWSPDADTIAVASVDETSLAKGWLRATDPVSQSVVAHFDTGNEPAWWVAFLDDDTVVANVGRDLRVWNVAR